MRKYEYETGRFTSIDPLWNKYYGWTPYQYSMNSPVSYTDGNGMEVEALDASGENLIKLSVEEKYETSVTFVDGILDWKTLKKKLPKNIDPNSNVATLVRLGQSSEVATVSGKTGEFKFKNLKGEIFTKNIYNYKSGDLYDENYDLFRPGYTFLPNGSDAAKADAFTLSGNTEIYINPSLDRSTLASSTAHELYFHFRLYLLNIRHYHENDYNNDPSYMRYWYRRYERQANE